MSWMRRGRTILPRVFLVDWIDELPISADDDDDDVCVGTELVALVGVSPAFVAIDGAASVTPVDWAKQWMNELLAR